MIKLDVCKYCDRCPHFEPEVVERPRVDMLTSYSVCEKCCNRDRCASIYEYMEGQKKC